MNSPEVLATTVALSALPELSDAEIGRLVDRMDNTHDSDLLKFARAVIAAMKGKQ